MVDYFYLQNFAINQREGNWPIIRSFFGGGGGLPLLKTIMTLEALKIFDRQLKTEEDSAILLYDESHQTTGKRYTAREASFTSSGVIGSINEDRTSLYVMIRVGRVRILCLKSSLNLGFFRKEKTFWQLVANILVDSGSLTLLPK